MAKPSPKPTIEALATRPVDGLDQSFGRHTVFCDGDYGKEVDRLRREGYTVLQDESDSYRIMMRVPDDFNERQKQSAAKSAAMLSGQAVESFGGVAIESDTRSEVETVTRQDR